MSQERYGISIQVDNNNKKTVTDKMTSIQATKTFLEIFEEPATRLPSTL